MQREFDFVHFLNACQWRERIPNMAIQNARSVLGWRIFDAGTNTEERARGRESACLCVCERVYAAKALSATQTLYGCETNNPHPPRTPGCNRTPTQFASVSIAIARVPGVSDNASHQNRFGIAGVGAGHENRSSFVAVANHSRLVPHAFSVGRLAARGRGLVVFLLVAFI